MAISDIKFWKFSSDLIFSSLNSSNSKSSSSNSTSLKLSSAIDKDFDHKEKRKRKLEAKVEDEHKHHSVTKYNTVSIYLDVFHYIQSVYKHPIATQDTLNIFKEQDCEYITEYHFKLTAKEEDPFLNIEDVEIQKFDKQPEVWTEPVVTVGVSPISGYGLFTLQRLDPGQMLIPYIGGIFCIFKNSVLSHSFFQSHPGK